MKQISYRATNFRCLSLKFQKLISKGNKHASDGSCACAVDSHVATGSSRKRSVTPAAGDAVHILCSATTPGWPLLRCRASASNFKPKNGSDPFFHVAGLQRRLIHVQCARARAEARKRIGIRTGTCIRSFYVNRCFWEQGQILALVLTGVGRQCPPPRAKASASEASFITGCEIRAAKSPQTASAAMRG